MFECPRIGEVPAIGPGKKTQTSRVRAGLFCALLAALAVEPFQVFAQTASSQTGSASQTTPTTSDESSTFLAPAAPAESPFLTANAIDLTEGYRTNAGSLQWLANGRSVLSGEVGLAEGYTTNAQQGTSNEATSFTRGNLGLGLHYTSGRFMADAHYSLTGYAYNGGFHSLNQLQNRLNLGASDVLVPNHLFINLRAFAAPTMLSRVGPLSANQAAPSNVNNTNSYGYTAQPTWQMRLGDYAFSQTSLSVSQVFFEQPLPSSMGSTLPFVPASNTTSTSATERIFSGPYSGRLKWALAGSYENTQQTAQSTQRSEGALSLAYAIDRAIAVVAQVGYGIFNSSVQLTQSLSGPIAIGGIRYSYGPNFTLVAGAGVKNNLPTYVGSLNWEATGTFNINGSLTDSVGTPQGNILGTLSTLALSANDVFSVSQSDNWQSMGQALFPQYATVSPIATLGLALDNSINLDRSARLSFVHHDERNQYGLSFFGDMRDRQNVTTSTTPPRSWVYGAGLHASRKLRRDLTGYAGVTYSLANEFSGHDRIVTANVGLNYQIAKTLNCYLTGSYLHRDSSGQTGVTNVPLSDFTAIVGIRHTLFAH